MIKFFLFITVPILFLGCNPEIKEVDKITRSITTTYISHQPDTKQKDDKTVAVATFLPDGTLDELIQHMTYPYDFVHPQTINLWGKTNWKAVPVILDGLSLDLAEYNFLYGNQWPLEYAAVAKNEHPAHKIAELPFKSLPNKFSSNEDGFPISIEFQNLLLLYETQVLTELFTYNKLNIQSFESFVTIAPNQSMKQNLPLGDSVMIANKKKYHFEYNDDLLSEMTLEKEKKIIKHQFDYNRQNQLSKARYFNNDVLYTTRVYEYDKAGLHTKTEIFNRDGEPEFTILYQYEFY